MQQPGRMMTLRELPLDHVAIAVHSIPDAIPIYEALMGGKATEIEQVYDQGVDVAFIGTGTGRIELIAPIADDSPVTRFLERRGPGLHHLAYRVPDLVKALERLTDEGIRLIDQVPRTGAHGHKIAFIHPESTGGVLIELVEG